MLFPKTFPQRSFSKSAMPSLQARNCWARPAATFYAGSVLACTIVVALAFTFFSSSTCPPIGVNFETKENPDTATKKVSLPEPYACLHHLPQWFVQSSSSRLRQAIADGSNGLTDKHTLHRYEHMYHRYMTPIAMRSCLESKRKKVRILEIGLGCAPNGGMVQGIPGGSARAWRYIFPSPAFDLDLHIMEYDQKCALKWSTENPEIATVHAGDQNSVNDLNRVLQQSGGAPFDVIIDDASHINEHQINTAEHLMQHLALGGIYIVEDIHASCVDWQANLGTHFGTNVGGTVDCMKTKDGKPTFYGKVVEWQKKLLVNLEPFPDVNHIDVTFEAAVTQKNLPSR